jgi:hypothetical protein
MQLTYRGVKYDKNEGLRNYLLKQIHLQEKLKREIAHERNNLTGKEIF